MFATPITIASGNVTQLPPAPQSPSPVHDAGVPPSGCAAQPATVGDEHAPVSSATSNAVSTFHVAENASCGSAAHRFWPSCMYTTG